MNTEQIQFIEPVELYNLLNQTNLNNSCLVDENYLLLFDSRKPNEYAENHVITARHVPCNENDQYIFSTNIDYSAMKYIIVIDNRASSLKDIGSSGVVCAQLLWKMGSKYPVKIVRGGFEDFSALYPFLRSQKRLFTQKEIFKIKMYPTEIETGFLFLGTSEQAHDVDINKHLKVKAHVNVSTSESQIFSSEDTVYGKHKDMMAQLLHINITDNVNSDISSHFKVACSFIDEHEKKDGRTVLIYSDLGISRNVTIALAYIISKHKIPLKNAIDRLAKCHQVICPNRAFIKSLLQWEFDVLGENLTSNSDLKFLSYD